MIKVLVVDDNPEIIEVVQERLELEGYQVQAANDVTGGAAAIASFKPDVVIVDVYLSPTERGIDLVKKIRATLPKETLPVLVVTGQPDSDLCLEALQTGANDFITKPIHYEELLKKLKQVIHLQTPLQETDAVWKEKIVGASPLVLEMIKKIYYTANSGADTLIIGETGTGKNLVVNQIHQLSQRKNKPLMLIDCTHIPPGLFESEVFGHEAHAFNDAAFRKGKVEEAEGGMVFFDQIETMPIEQQAKLLLLLETKTFSRLGSNQRIEVNVMFLAATNKDLQAMADQGKFRHDLYYRLIGNIIHVPPLREHKEDIPVLCEHMLRKHAQRLKKNILRIEPEVIQVLQRSDWLGNIRQLEKAILQGVINCQQQVLTLADFGHLEAVESKAHHSTGERSAVYQQRYTEARDGVLLQFHKDYLLHHLRRTNWNISQAAKNVGITREYFNKLMKEHDISRPE